MAGSKQSWQFRRDINPSNHTKRCYKEAPIQLAGNEQLLKDKDTLTYTPVLMKCQSTADTVVFSFSDVPQSAKRR